MFLHPARRGVGDVGPVKVGESVKEPYGGDLLKLEAMPWWIDTNRRPYDAEVNFAHEAALDHGINLIIILQEPIMRILAFSSIHWV